MTTTDRSGLRRVSIEASTLILVGGVDDRNFLKEFLAFCGISDIQIEEVGGKDRFSKFLRLLLPAAPNLSQLRSLAVMRDADLDVTAAQASVTGMLRAFIRRLENGAQETTSIRTSQFLFPDNRHTGTLETLLWSTVPDGQQSCVKKFLACAEDDWGAPLAERWVDKARVHAYLASSPLKVEGDGKRGSTRSRPGLLTGVSVRAGIWDLNHDAFNPLLAFAQRLWMVSIVGQAGNSTAGVAALGTAVPAACYRMPVCRRLILLRRNHWTEAPCLHRRMRRSWRGGRFRVTNQIVADADGHGFIGRA